MMEVTVSELVERVKVNMEELTDVREVDISMEIGIDIEQYIQEKIPDALLAVWSTEPAASLPQVDCATSLQPQSRPEGSGRVILPDDVWRMVEFCIEGWRQPVTSFIDHSSPMYELQFNRYTRGGISSPVCVLSKDGGQKYLDYYSLPPHVELHRVKSARYVAYPDKNASSYEISPPLIPAVCYTCAALVYEILGRPEQAAAMLRCIVR